MLNEINKERLSNWLHRRVGYGNLTADWWFLGMEESCVNADIEITERITGDFVEDLYDAHKRLFKLFPGINQLFEGPTVYKIKLQRTWAMLIRSILAYHGASANRVDIKRYQAKHLGRTDGETLLLDLMPLPSPSTGTWPYSMSGIPNLETRNSYKKTFLPKRIEFLRGLMATYRPTVAVAYGKNNWEYYRAIVGAEKHWQSLEFGAETEWGQYCIIPEGGKSRIAILAPFPSRKGGKGNDWLQLGRQIRKLLGSY